MTNHTLLIKTKDFTHLAIKKEIKTLTKQSIKSIHKGLYQIKLKEDEITDFTSKVVFYSRLTQRIYLKASEFGSTDFIKFEKTLPEIINKNLTFSVRCEKSFTKADHQQTQEKIGNIISENFPNLSVNLDKPDLPFKVLSSNSKNYLCIDLADIKLTKRHYKANSSFSSLNAIIPNYLFHLLELSKQKEISVLDPNANLGEVIIEASLLNKPTHIKQRQSLPILKLFNQRIPIPLIPKTKDKLIAVVQDNKTFKMLRENINLSGQKIKISQYDFDWLDVKFHKGDIDYVITQFPNIKDEQEYEQFQKDFFYQAEFVKQKKIGIITKLPINEKIAKKNKLKVTHQEEIYNSEQKYWLYVLK